MNILYFTHEKEYGGSSRALIALIKELKENNNIYVVTPFKNAKINKELSDMNIKTISCFYSWWQIPVRASILKRLIFRILYIFNNISIIVLSKKIKKLNIDIIHSNTSAIDIGAKISNKLKIPHVWHFREFKENNLKFIRRDKKSYDYINKYGGYIIYISKAIKEFYDKNIHTDKCRLIYDGVSPEFIIKDKEYKNCKEIKLLLAGTLHEGKGQQLAVEAIGKLKKEGYNNIKLYLAGGDPIGYSNYINTIIDKYDIKDNVEYLGFVNNLKDIRKNVDIELLCSESEAFGLVTIEGMLAGNPIIGSNSGATGELIVDGETGLLYECNNVDDLAEKIKFLIDKPETIKKYGTQARTYAMENFLSNKNAIEILKYYKEILEK